MKAKSLALALALFWATGAGAAQDFDGSTGYAESTSVEITAVPLTMCAWFNTDSNTVAEAIFSLNSIATTTEIFYIIVNGAVSGDPIRAQTFEGGIPAVASTSTGISTATWHQACGVFTNNSSRDALIDGGSKGSNTDSSTPGTVVRTNLASRWDGFAASRGLFWDGRIAEVGLWNVALSDAEVASLAKGLAPPCVRRGSLVAYYPMVRDTTSLKDLFSGTANNLTLAGTNSVADHPRITYCN